ncbi:MAG: DUF1080 domain-containing protein [Chitinophagaceae bacterium]|nr:DUF1080 domain-containing protein [Chitinophagaceae bacterium]
MNTVIRTMLSLLVVMTSFQQTPAQIKMGEVIFLGKVPLKKEMKPDAFQDQFSKHIAPSWSLFKADRGDRKGDFLFYKSGTESASAGNPFTHPRLAPFLDNNSIYTKYQLIGADKLQPPRTIGILGVHYIKVKPERSKDFEKFVAEKLHPAVGNLLPDMQLLYYKATAGENAGSYITIFAIESTAARDKYWPTGAPETDVLKQAFKPLDPLAAELGTYLVGGSFLEPPNGAAAYWESKEWTDFIAQDENTSVKTPPGFVSLFNGKDLTNWKIPAGDNGHWKVINAAIDYDAESESSGDKSLWSEKSYKNFVLYVDFRIKATPWKNEHVPIILPSGLHKKDENGKEINIVLPDSDSGILLRGEGKCQANIWCWPIGCGEVYGYRMDTTMPPSVRRGATPKTNADKNIGEWNTFKITFKGERLTVELNGITVIENAHMPGIAASGPIGLQHHGAKENGEWVSPPSLVQFRNIFIKEL